MNLQDRSGDASVDAAQQISELVRYLNHATLDAPADALPDPATINHVLGRLYTACRGLPQLLSQISTRAAVLGTDPDLAAGNGKDPQALIARTGEGLTSAGEAVRAVLAGIGDAQRAVDWLYLNRGGDEDS
jgi:hypothetical protein